MKRGKKGVCFFCNLFPHRSLLDHRPLDRPAHQLLLPRRLHRALQGLTLPGSSRSGRGVALAGGKIAVDAEGRTSLEKVWAGGDCATGGDDLTVTAVTPLQSPFSLSDASLVGRTIAPGESITYQVLASGVGRRGLRTASATITTTGGTMTMHLVAMVAGS